jgi:hypothetical protein
MINDLLDILEADGRVDLTLPTEKAAKDGGLQLSVLLNQVGHPVNVVRAANTLTLTTRSPR